MSKLVTVRLNKSLVKAIATKASKQGMHDALDYLAEQSKQQVPLDTGALKNSCEVSVNEDGSSGTVSYDTPYAVRQHEELSYNHQRGRKAKYLEDPANDPDIQSKMATLIQNAFKGEM